MQLHDPRAQRRATATYRLSATVDTLSPKNPILCTQLGPQHWHLVVRDGEDYGLVAETYAFAPGIPDWISARLYGIFGVVSPAVSRAGYERTRWWDLDWPIGPDAVELLEEAGGDLVDRWPHAWLL